jgi:large subunit ribosomal protein L25
MENVLEVQKREEKGKIGARRLRKKGLTPGVIYGKNIKEAIPLSFKIDALKKMLKGSGKGLNLVIKFRSKDPELNDMLALVKNYEIEPISRAVQHVDFWEVSLASKTRVKVHIELEGKPIGVTMGGILDHITREIEIECLPTDIPDKITIDVRELKIGHSIHVKDIKLKEDIKILTDPETTIAAVSAVKEEEVAPAAPAAETAEPEVIKKGKEEVPEEEKEATAEEEKKSAEKKDEGKK